MRDLFALRIEETRADQAVPYSPPSDIAGECRNKVPQGLKPVVFAIVYGPAKETA
jgi:hypothetical protein